MTIPQEMKAELIERGEQARQLAYAPYSNYPVGAALLTESGEIFTGTNIENASYPLSICAERVAVFKAVSAGNRRPVAISVVTDNGGSPCGACRQVLAEFGLDTRVIMADGEGNIVHDTTVRELLPQAFTPEHLA